MAIFVARQSGVLFQASPLCVRAAGWLSVVSLLLLLTLTPGTAAVTTYTDPTTYGNALTWYEVGIGFEDKTGEITNQYASLGANFSVGAYGDGPLSSVTKSSLGGSLPRGLRALRTEQKAPIAPDTMYSYGVRITFNTPVKSFGGYHLDVGTTLKVALYNSSGALIGQSDFAGGGEGGTTTNPTATDLFFGCISSERNIKHVDLYTLRTSPGDFFALDDLQFTGPLTDAAVAVYDNWIGFGAFSPTEGTAASPAKVIAAKSPASAWGPTVGIPAVGSYDVGYLQISAPTRLNLSVTMNGNLKRCTATGQAFAGVDTRKQTPGPYELATQWKVAFYGKYLSKPSATTFISPTSNTPTAFNAWTGWSTGGNDPVSDSGWLWPIGTDAWTGNAVSGYAVATGLDLLVERGQYTGSPTGAPAGLAIIERVLRRGQQDVEGNYKQIIDVTLTYAE